MGDRPGSLKLGSFKLFDVGGREPGCPGRGCILSDAALCGNVDFSNLALANPRSYRPRQEGGWFAEAFAGTPF